MKNTNFIFIVLALIINLKTQGQNLSDSLVLSSFSQGSSNNCASIALIKAAMYKYGYENIFNFKKQLNVYEITLKDGTLLKLAEKEYDQAVEYSNFDTSGNFNTLGNKGKEILHYAYLAYAIIAKNITNNGYWDCLDLNNNSKHIKKIKGYENALLFISRKGFCTDNAHRLLGLKIKNNKIFDYNSENILNEKGIILYSWGHAVFVYNNFVDCFGEWKKLNGTEICNNNFKWYVVLD